MRIISGQWRGRQIVAPKGDATRPTADRTREALFSMLASRLGGFEGLAVADLFAGSGAPRPHGLPPRPAAGPVRGAAAGPFVETARAGVEAIRRNLAALGASGEILSTPAEHVRLPGPVD